MRYLHVQPDRTVIIRIPLWIGDLHRRLECADSHHGQQHFPRANLPEMMDKRGSLAR